MLPEYIKIEHPTTYEEIEVKSSDYVKAKTKDLRAFGYEELTESEVENQLNLVLTGGKVNIIGMFIQKDIVRPE